uniref:FF domain-containing protein n=1 Tax=Heterorhabditis bacteriophora TaxID=37862 RepID=A0A1I7WK86_HETBA
MVLPILILPKKEVLPARCKAYVISESRHTPAFPPRGPGGFIPPFFPPNFPMPGRVSIIDKCCNNLQSLTYYSAGASSPKDTTSPGQQPSSGGMPADAIAEAQAKAQAALAAYLAQEKKDNTRPVSSTPVSGTPWCVVWTGDGKVSSFALKEEPQNGGGDTDDGSEEDEDGDGGPPKKKSRAERKKEALMAQQKKEKTQQLLQKCRLKEKERSCTESEVAFIIMKKKNENLTLRVILIVNLKQAKKEFITLLEEQTSLTRKSKWSSIKKTIEDDERYKALDSSSTREQLFREFVEKLGDESLSDMEEEAEREKRLAADAAIAARQREVFFKYLVIYRIHRFSGCEIVMGFIFEVEAELGDKLRERDKESEKHRVQEHEERYRALMVDLVKSAEMSWHDARRLLRKDERYAECDLLDKEKKESLFNDHLRSLEKKRRDAFFSVLDEHPKITTQTRWKEARRIIQDEEDVFSKVASNSERKVERDYRDWQEERHDNIVRDFKDLLKETKIITYKSKKLMEDNEQHLKDILAVLENDKRWMRMSENHASERDRVLEDYIEQLHKKGTPPPPTQQERERRRKD